MKLSLQKARLIALLLLIAQSSSVPDSVINTVQQLTPVLSQLVVIVLLIALPILVFRILLGEVIAKL